MARVTTPEFTADGRTLPIAWVEKGGRTPAFIGKTQFNEGYIIGRLHTTWLCYRRGSCHPLNVHADTAEEAMQHCTDYYEEFLIKRARKPVEQAVSGLKRLAAAMPSLRKRKPVICGGDSKLWAWFGLSHASWLTVPRVLMHEMPDEWQDKMADLLNEYEKAFPNQSHLPSVTVRARDDKGRMSSMPEFLNDYRYPDRKEINRLRRDES